MARRGRPRADAEQYRRASDLYFGGIMSSTEIWTFLTEEFEDSDVGRSAASERTVARWVQEFRETGKGEADAPFRWHRLDEYDRRGYGIAWETSPAILEKDVYFQEHLAETQRPAPLSVRQLRWWHRVHMAAPDIGLNDSFWLSQRFVGREQMHDLLDEPLDMEDLDGHLAYRPWASPEERRAYLRAVEHGRVRRRPAVEPLTQLARLKLRGLEDMRPVGMAMMAAGVPGEYPEMLVSQQFHIVNQLIAGRSEWEALQSAFEHYRRADDWYSERRKSRTVDMDQDEPMSEGD